MSDLLLCAHRELEGECYECAIANLEAERDTLRRRVAFLEAWQAWARALADSAMLEVCRIELTINGSLDCQCEVCAEWLAANPEPTEQPAADKVG